MARVDVVMPKMGESVMEGTVLEWKKSVGDEVGADETLLEISTDKVDSEVPSPAAGRLAEVLVAEGETVEVGTPIAVIETDVAVAVAAPAPPAEAPAEEAAAAAEVTPAADAPAAAEATPAPAASAPDAPASQEPAVEVNAASPVEVNIPAEAAMGADEIPSMDGMATEGTVLGNRVEVVMPKMGESVMEGTVLVWKHQVGDHIEQDETLLEISTDKVDSEVPSPAEGVLVEILVAENETVDVGTPIAIIAEGAAAGTAPPAPRVAAPAARAAQAATVEGEAPPVTPSPPGVADFAGAAGDGSPAPAGAVPAAAISTGPIPRRSESGRFFSPLVRSIAAKEGLSVADLEAIAGTGAEGRVTKRDVLGFLERRPTPAARTVAPAAPALSGKPAPATPAASGERVEVVEMDRMRQMIAEHMRRSKDTSAHVTSFTEIDVTGLVRHREANKKAFEAREGVKLTYTPYFLLGAIEPLREHRWLNASVEGTRILVRKDFHIGIAVALGTRGLIVPVVRDAGGKNLTGLARSVSDLAERARSKQLLPDELQGGTFTVTNVGSLGSLMGTPIINQPQVAILSPGAIVKRPVVVEDPNMGDVIAVRHMVYVSLSYDHRIIDGAMAASFLRAYRESLESVTEDSQLL